MKKIMYKGFAFGLAVVVVLQLNAQQSRYKTGGAAKTATKTPASSYINTSKTKTTGGNDANTQPVTPAATGGSKYRAGNNQTPTVTTDATSTTISSPGATSGSTVVKFNYDTTGDAGLDGKPEVSLRNNYAAERTQVKDRKPLEYEDLREDDALFSHFIWREIDAREKMNQSFTYAGKDENGDQRFFAILMNAVRSDSVIAFSSENDRFTTPLSPSQVLSLTSGKLDTIEVTDPISGAVEKTVTRAPQFSPDSVYTFRIKEQVVFDKEASRLFTRIIGIAPIAKQVIGGKSIPRVLFWVYYPDMRRTLAKFDVYNPKNLAGRMTWEELFESRYFTSYIIKSTIDNPGDKYLSTAIKDPLFRLLEGENIKTKIFNFEQDLWSY
jgi:gliding motility associated protien GldN